MSGADIAPLGQSSYLTKSKMPGTEFDYQIDDALISYDISPLIY